MSKKAWSKPEARELIAFAEALRAVLRLEPLYGNERSTANGMLQEERFYRTWADPVPDVE